MVYELRVHGSIELRLLLDRWVVHNVIYNARMLEVQVALEELQLAVHLLIH
jgi:hypothetical protein